jgi:hypothetical protein
LSWPNALKAFDDNLFSAFQPISDNSIGPFLASRFDPLDDSFSVLDSEYVDSFLIGYQSRLWNNDLQLRLTGFESDIDYLPVD